MARRTLRAVQFEAVGEPPLLYGIGAFFALMEAMKARNPMQNSS